MCIYIYMYINKYEYPNDSNSHGTQPIFAFQQCLTDFPTFSFPGGGFGNVDQRGGSL